MEIAEAAGGVLALAAQLVLATGVALAAAERPSFLAPTLNHRGAAFIAGPLAGLWPALTRETSMLRWDATLALLAMLACWALAVACARRTGLAAVMVTAVARRRRARRSRPRSRSPTPSTTCTTGGWRRSTGSTRTPTCRSRRPPTRPSRSAPGTTSRAPTGRCSRSRRRRSRRSASRPPTGCSRARCARPPSAWPCSSRCSRAGSGAIPRRRSPSWRSTRSCSSTASPASTTTSSCWRCCSAARCSRSNRRERARRRRVGGRRGDQALRRPRAPDPPGGHAPAPAGGGRCRARGDRGARAGAGRLRRAPAQRRRAGAAGGDAQPGEPARDRDRARRPRRRAARRARGRPRAGHGRAVRVDVAHARVDDRGRVGRRAADPHARLGDAVVRDLDAPVRGPLAAPGAAGGGDRADGRAVRHVGAGGRDRRCTTWAGTDRTRRRRTRTRSTCTGCCANAIATNREPAAIGPGADSAR